MKKQFRYFAAAAMLVALAACGGGGGGGGSDTTSVTPPPVNPPVVNPPPVNPPAGSVTCPNGTPAASADACALVTADVSSLQGSTQSPDTLAKGVTFRFNGKLDTSKTSVEWTREGLNVGTTQAQAITNNVTDVTVTPSVRPAFGGTTTITVTGVDSIGRVVRQSATFGTIAMSCTSNARWSNPANFSSQFEACAAPLGVQALFDPVLNTRQPNDGCTFTPGVALSLECMYISANGTLVLNDTSVIVQNNPVEWMGYNSSQAGNLTGTIVLVDRTTMKVIDVKTLPNEQLWTIGNPYGEAVRYQAFVGGASQPITAQASYDGSHIQTVCKVNCPSP